MGEEWTDRQFVSLGYDPERFRHFRTRLVREPFVQSLSKELRDKRELQHATIVQNEARDNFFDLIVGVSDPVLAFVDKQFAEQLVADTERSFFGNISQQKGYLVVSTHLLELNRMSAGLAGAMGLTAVGSANKVAGKGYYADTKPDGFFKNNLQFGVRTKKFVGTDPADYKICRYFEFFTDHFNRADLAYAMLHLAVRCKKRGVYAQHLANPDMWYVVETRHTARIYFAGSMLFVKEDSKNFIDPACTLLLRTHHNEVLGYPNPTCFENCEDPLVYAMALVSGLFDDWVPDQFGEYAPHKFVKKSYMVGWDYKASQGFYDLQFRECRKLLFEEGQNADDLTEDNVARAINELFNKKDW